MYAFDFDGQILNCEIEYKVVKRRDVMDTKVGRRLPKLCFRIKNCELEEIKIGHGGMPFTPYTLEYFTGGGYKYYPEDGFIESLYAFFEYIRVNFGAHGPKFIKFQKMLDNHCKEHSIKRCE